MEEAIPIRKCRCSELLKLTENIRCEECRKILRKIVKGIDNTEKTVTKEDATHRIEIIAKFNPAIISENEIKEIILARRDFCEIIEYEFSGDNTVNITVYIFSVGQWDAESIELYVNSLLAGMTIPDGIKKSDIAVKVKKPN